MAAFNRLRVFHWLLVFRRVLAWNMLRGERPPAAASLAASRAVHPLSISAVRRETAEATTFEFAVPAHLQAQFAAQPGQFLSIRVPCEEPPLWRCYSLSAPAESGARLRVTVKRVAGGRASNWLLDHLQPGSPRRAVAALACARPASAGSLQAAWRCRVTRCSTSASWPRAGRWPARRGRPVRRWSSSTEWPRVWARLAAVDLERSAP